MTQHRPHRDPWRAELLLTDDDDTEPLWRCPAGRPPAPTSSRRLCGDLTLSRLAPVMPIFGAMQQKKSELKRLTEAVRQAEAELDGAHGALRSMPRPDA